MNIAQHTKRTTGVVGLLAALALTASGCSAGANRATPPSVPAQEAAPKTKLADAPIFPDDYYKSEGIPEALWYTEADIAAIKKNAIAALQVLIEDHPEFTVEGFQPTPEIWNNEVAPKLKPLIMGSKWKNMTEDWMKVSVADETITADQTFDFRANVVLTNNPIIKDDSKHPLYDVIRSWKTEGGEKCSPSDKSYDVDVKGVGMTSFSSEDDSYVYPMVSSNMAVTVHCKEGGKLKTDLLETVELRPENGQWLVSQAGLMYTAGGHRTMEK
jgi:hypothetical protein